jgi:hypothetical protein
LWLSHWQKYESDLIFEKMTYFLILNVGWALPTISGF